MSETIYKLLNADRSPCHGGRGIWPELGIWTEPREPVPCKSGYHGLRVSDLSRWIKTGTVLWTMEGRGKCVVCDDKIVYAEARLIERVGTLSRRQLQLFAADCAEHVLHFFEKKYPEDSRPRQAINAARSGNAATAAADAAAYAATAAADAAAYAATAAAAAYAAADAYAAYAAYAASAAAHASAYAAADAAAYDDAAADAERLWQGQRLLAYLTDSEAP